MPNPQGNAAALPRRPGRPKGSRNKTPEKLRQAVLEALHNVGGVAYLEDLALNEPKVFGQLLGKVLPRQHDLQLEGKIQQTVDLQEIEEALNAGRARVARLKSQSRSDNTVIDVSPDGSSEAAVVVDRKPVLPSE